MRQFEQRAKGSHNILLSGSIDRGRPRFVRMLQFGSASHKHSLGRWNEQCMGYELVVYHCAVW